MTETLFRNSFSSFPRRLHIKFDFDEQSCLKNISEVNGYIHIASGHGNANSITSTVNMVICCKGSR